MDYNRNILLGRVFLLQGRVRKCGLLLIKFKDANVTLRGHSFLNHRMRQSSGTWKPVIIMEYDYHSNILA